MLCLPRCPSRTTNCIQPLRALQAAFLPALILERCLVFLSQDQLYFYYYYFYSASKCVVICRYINSDLPSKYNSGEFSGYIPVTIHFQEDKKENRSICKEYKLLLIFTLTLMFCLMLWLYLLQPSSPYSL